MFIYWWTGHDALRLVKHTMKLKRKKIYTYIWRLFWRIFANRFTHWVVADNLADHLRAFGITREIETHIMYSKCSDCYCEKVPHNTFNVLIYMPKPVKSLLGSNKEYTEWVYSYDIIREVMAAFPANYIIVDGSQNMCEIWPYIDCMIRPNRHDGMPRMVLEAQNLNIPYYWDETFQPTTEKVLEFLNAIQTTQTSYAGEKD